MYTHMNVFTECSRLKLANLITFFHTTPLCAGIMCQTVYLHYILYIYVYVHINATTLHTVLYFVYDPAEQLVQVVLPSTAAYWPRGHSGQ